VRKIREFLSRLIQRELQPLLSAEIANTAAVGKLIAEISLLREQIAQRPLIDEQTGGMLGILDPTPVPKTSKGWMRRKQELELADMRRELENEARRLAERAG
jgi:hypothetical protein